MGFHKRAIVISSRALCLDCGWVWRAKSPTRCPEQLRAGSAAFQHARNNGHRTQIVRITQYDPATLKPKSMRKRRTPGSINA